MPGTCTGPPLALAAARTRSGGPGCCAGAARGRRRSCRTARGRWKAAAHEVLIRLLRLDMTGAMTMQRRTAPRQLPRHRAAGYLPRMILLRHGQSEFNLHFTATRRDPGILDPKLTAARPRSRPRPPPRRWRARALRRIIASPYTRALQTAAPIARRLGLPVLIHPIVRERYAFTCDVGTPPGRAASSAGRTTISPASRRSGGRRSRSRPTRYRARAALFRAEMAALPDWARHAGGQPLGVHPVDDRAQRRRTASGCAATRPRRRRPRSSGCISSEYGR